CPSSSRQRSSGNTPLYRYGPRGCAVGIRSAGGIPMKQKSVAVVGAAETTKLGVIPDMSQIQLHAAAALNAMKDCGLKPSDIDGIATAGEVPQALAQYLGITPTWADGTAVGGCSFMLHVRHAAAAINE